MNDKLLTLVISNRDRLCIDSNSTNLWIRSIMNQQYRDFNVIVVDGGSKNYTQIKNYLSNYGIVCIQYIIGEKFHRGLLNNVGIRKSNTPYIMASDADMFFAPEFFLTVYNNLSPNVFIESRTMYWNTTIAKKIYSGELDPVKDLKSCKIGRIKKRTTAGGCQCGHINMWEKVRGYDERYIGWGSEDVDLLQRVHRAEFRVRWLGESIDSIMLFHQPHEKFNYKQDMKDQYSNLEYYKNIKTYKANHDGWGGIP